MKGPEVSADNFIDKNERYSVRRRKQVGHKNSKELCALL